jgi:4-alpha-glucanotransferase
MHPTSLPGGQGVGTLGREAVRFLDFLQAAGMSYWQICPLGPTGFGDSPYQCFSAFAGNPYLVDFEDLAERGLLTAEEIEPVRRLPRDKVDYGGLYREKWPILKKAFARFQAAGNPNLGAQSYEEFKEAHAAWLEPYALFLAIKDEQGGGAWTNWPPELRQYAQAAKGPAAKRLGAAMEAHRFFQYAFYNQWRQVREQANGRGIRVIGDMPIFVAADSADVWAQPELFELDPKTGIPLAVAGVPPDYFSADGQLWGNPLYDWKRHAATGYAWWKARLGAAFELYDILRIDHFRGFDEYWRVPYPAQNAKGGKWVEGPGLELFEQVQAAFPEAKIIAEDLGLLTESVVALRKETGLPGMAVLQFAFGGKHDNLYLPHNLSRNSDIYPGTHDNDTTLGWYATAPENVKDHARRYLRVSGAEIGWDFIRAAYHSVSRLAVIPIQDILTLGSEARLNSPGRAQGNWQWRCREDQLSRLFQPSAQYLKELGNLTGRLPTMEKEG